MASDYKALPVAASAGANTYLEVKASPSSAWPATQGATHQLNSLTLTTGDWDLVAQVTAVTTGASESGSIDVFISENAGASQDDYEGGVNYTGCPFPSTTVVKTVTAICALRVNVVAASKTYYIKAIANVLTSTTNITLEGYKFSARKAIS